MAKNDYNNRSFKVKKEVNPQVVMSIAACVLGLLSLIFLAAPGIKFNYSIAGKDPAIYALGNLIWGGGDNVAYLSGGLVAAFFLTIAASLIVLATGGFHYIAYLAFLVFITAGVLYFCAIPFSQATLAMISKRGTPVLGWGTYMIGILNFICAGICFFAGRGD
jgi:hypothetical protein